MMMPTVVCIAVIFTLNICDAFINNPRWAFHPTFRQPESYTRPLSEEKQPFRRLREDHSLVLSMTENIDDEPFINVVKKKQKRKSRANAEIMKYSDEVIQSWKMSDSFNSTTMRLLFNFRDDISGNWAKVERTFASWILVVTSKVERDIKTTFKTGDFVKRKIAKETKSVITSVTKISKPLLSLPSTIQRLSEKEDTWDLIRVGVNPLGEERMLGNLNAKNTRERASLPKKKVVNILAADSIYRSVRLLPNKLKYDFDRKKISQEMKRNERKDRNVKLLPDGNKRKIQISKITPLLPSYIDVQYDEEDGYMEGAEEQEQYDKQEESTSQFNEYTGKGQEEEFFFYLTKEEAVRSQQLMKLLSSFSTAIKEGAITALKAELDWALTVGEETLRVVALENSMSGDKPIDGSNSQAINDEDTDTVRAAADDKSKKDFKKWGMNRVAESINSLVAAIEACTRLSTLPDQVDEVVKSREKEREIRIRSGDFNDLRRGVEVFVEGMTAKRNAGSVTVVADEVEAEAEEKVDMYMIGWGDSEEGVKERITSNRALLAGIYSLTDGVEDLLAEHRRCQREAGRTRANKSDSVQAQREKDIWWTSLQGGTVTAEESVDSVPEGLMKESKNADDFENVMEKEVVEKRKETVNVTYESEVRIGVDVGAKKVVPKVQRGWSPGMSVKPIQPESSVPAEEPVIDVEEKKAAKEVEVSETTKESEDINEFFLFIAEDTDATSGDEYIYNDTRGRADNQEWNAESRFVETTVETTERDSDKIVAFLATSLDVTFFLFETIIKSVFPLLMGGGALAADRAVEALSIGLIISPKVFSRSREIGKDAKEDSMGSWKLLAEFKKQSTVL